MICYRVTVADDPAEMTRGGYDERSQGGRLPPRVTEKIKRAVVSLYNSTVEPYLKRRKTALK